MVAGIRSLLPAHVPVYVVAVANRVGPPLNMLPAAYAERLARDLDGKVWTGIAKVAGGHNTGAAVDERLHNRQVFSGPLPPQGSAIVIADDIFTVGGTLTALVDHLAREGNTPVCATTLASGRYGPELAPTRELIDGLLDKAGVDARQFEEELGYADEGTRLRMRDAGMYWAPDQRVWVTALTNDRAMRLLDRHPLNLKNPEYLRQVQTGQVNKPIGRGAVERNFQAEIDTRGEAERFGRASYNAFNVAITRARHGAMVFTNSLPGLKQAVVSVDGKSSTVDNKLLSRLQRVTRAMQCGVREPSGVVSQPVRQQKPRVPDRVQPGVEFER